MEPTNPQLENLNWLTKHKLLGYLFLALVFAGAVGLAYWWQYGLGNSNQITGNEQPDETDDWKTYSNDKYKYSLNYPPNYFFEIKSDDLIYFKNSTNPEEIIELDSATVNAKNQSIFDWIRSQKWPDSKPLVEQFEKEEVANIEAYRQIQTGTIYFAYSGRIFIISNGISSNRYVVPEAIMHRFLSSFEVNQTDETADWRTYRNDEYGFEFKYPQDWTLVECDGEHHIIFNVDNCNSDLYTGTIQIEDKATTFRSGESIQIEIGDMFASKFMGDDSEYISFVKNNKFYYLDFFYFKPGPDNNPETTETLLSTFQFIK